MSASENEPREERKKKKEKKKIKKEEKLSVTAKEKEENEAQKPEVNSSECVLLRGIFKVGKKSHDVLLTSTTLTWTPIMPESPIGEVCSLRPGVLMLRDVFAAKVKRRRAAGQPSGGPVLGIALFYCKRRGRRLVEETLHLHNASSEHAHTWYNTLKKLLTGFSSRPRCVKVFINPSSHKKEAVYIYREHVAPLFKMADVRTDITVTEMRGHALSVMKELKLDEFDGVVCVGGDGSVAELCHALVLRAQLDAGSPESPVRAPLPLGIIPAGSTDVVSCSVHGVRDPVTAAMHIILAGGHVQLLLAGTAAALRLLRHVWLWGAEPGAGREEEVDAVVTATADDCQLSFRASDTNNTPSEQLDEEQDQDQNGDLEGAESWTTVQGLYLSISIMAIPCLSPHAPRGLAPNTRLANGSAELIAVGDTSRSEFIKHLKRYSTSSGQFNSSFVETHAVSAVRLCPRKMIGCSEEESEDDSKMTAIIQPEAASVFPWNIDGELVEIPNEVLIRVHPGLITLYGEEVHEAESNVSCSCI
ncbi:ceramide kinase-like protein isoform X2 [Dunckerocampus dactyliophorus]|uniref:ceramide kinase-like protein isoform X2 n=1 Tax=Dunckerocampus dactyliophorus TaxID=161453 RepID=UPI002406C214|nr:ceramide kinase-like protein isoform X2 [Dunckerocampus dactyliophorus]